MLDPHDGCQYVAGSGTDSRNLPTLLVTTSPCVRTTCDLDDPSRLHHPSQRSWWPRLSMADVSDFGSSPEAATSSPPNASARSRCGCGRLPTLLAVRTHIHAPPQRFQRPLAARLTPTATATPAAPRHCFPAEHRGVAVHCFLHRRTSIYLQRHLDPSTPLRTVKEVTKRVHRRPNRNRNRNHRRNHNHSHGDAERRRQRRRRRHSDVVVVVVCHHATNDDVSRPPTTIGGRRVGGRQLQTRKHKHRSTTQPTSRQIKCELLLLI